MTPQAGDGEFCTPRTSGRAMDKQTHLATQIAMLPTPAQTDYKGESQFAKYNNPHRTADVIERSQDGQKTGMKLQPAFALWMMGFPPDWCDLKDGE